MPGAGPSQLQPPRKVGSTQTSVTLAWDGPHAEEAGAVTSYILERDQGGDGNFQPAYIGPEATCTVQGMQAGVIHHFRVQAENKVRPAQRCRVVCGLPGCRPAACVAGQESAPRAR